MSPASGFTTWTRVRAVASHRTTTSPTWKRDSAYTGPGQCRLCGSFLDSHLEHGETCSTAEATRGHYACVHAVFGGLQLAEPGITTEPRGRPADFFTAAAVPGRSWTCVWRPPMQQQPEVMQHRRFLIVKSHITDIKLQTFEFKASYVAPWFGQQTVDHTHKCNMQQYVAACRNGQQMSTKALQHRWKREIPTAFLRRRAAVTRAVPPHTSARELLLAGLMDREPPAIGSELTRLGGGDDHDADTGTDTTVPDDDSEDIASLTSQQSTPPQLSNFQSYPLAPFGMHLELEIFFKDHGVCSGTMTDPLDPLWLIIPSAAEESQHRICCVVSLVSSALHPNFSKQFHCCR